jgi:hypothetical protein
MTSSRLNDIKSIQPPCHHSFYLALLIGYDQCTEECTKLLSWHAPTVQSLFLSRASYRSSTPTLAVHALLRDRHLDCSVTLSCSSFVIRQQGSPSSHRALFLLPERCRQDGGHTLSSDPARGAFHARGTRDFGVMDVQNLTF